MKSIKILLIEDNHDDVFFITEMLNEQTYEKYIIVNEIRLDNGIDKLQKENFDVILLDLSLPDSHGFETFKTIQEIAPDKPIVVLSGLNDEQVAFKAVSAGAQDYLIKGQVNSSLLTRSIRYSIERKHDREELKRLNASKDKFFSLIAHDLKSPFTSFMGITSMLAEEYDEFTDTERKDLVLSIQNSAHRIFNLLENLLEWSRIQSGRIEYMPEKMDILYIIKNAKNLYSENAANKNITVDDSECNSHFVYIDDNMIYTVLRNLLSNAIKFTPVGGSIKFTNTVKDKMMHLSIEDNGMGMRREDMLKMFRIDVQFTTQGTNNEIGTGLGLILCKELIEKNNGKIWVESEITQGSVFTLALPLYDFIEKED